MPIESPDFSDDPEPFDESPYGEHEGYDNQFADATAAEGPQDGYPTNDILPTSDADTYDHLRVEYADEQVPAFHPWKLRRFHYIGGTAIEGKPDDPAGRQAMEHVSRTLGREHTETELAVARINTLSYEAEYDEPLAMANWRLAQDFGDTYSGLPIAPLYSEEYDQVFPPGTTGTNSFGHAIVRMDHADLALFKEPYVLRIALREGAHTAPADSIEVVGVQAPDTKRFLKPAIPGKWGAAAIYQQQFLTPVADPEHGGVRMDGSFFEDGFADSYAVRSVEALKYYRRFDGTVDVSNVPDAPMGYTDGSARHVHPRTGSLYLPAKYATGVARVRRFAVGDPGLVFKPVPAELAAYGIDLLDKRSPGLYDDMLASRQNPELKPRIAERIERISPGLYDKLNALQATTADFHSGLRLILDKLGLTDSYVS